MWVTPSPVGAPVGARTLDTRDDLLDRVHDLMGQGRRADAKAVLTDYIENCVGHALVEDCIQLGAEERVRFEEVIEVIGKK